MGLARVHMTDTASEKNFNQYEVAMLDVKPVLDYIVIQRIEQVSPSGLVLRTIADIPGPRKAKVIALGPGRPSEWNAEIIPMPVVEVGDTVLYHGGAGTKWEEDGEAYWWIFPRDLMGVVG